MHMSTSRAARVLSAIGLALTITASGFGTAHAAAGSDRLLAGEKLMPGQQISSGTAKLVMQSDGNLVDYAATSVRWSSNTARLGGNWAVLQHDGNIVVYSASNLPVWSSGTARMTGDGGHLVLFGDGKIVLYAGPSGAVPLNTVTWLSTEASVRDLAVTTARKRIGTTYCWAGGDFNGPTHGDGTSQGCTSSTVVGFDCSGLALYSWYQASGGAVRLPHLSGSQYSAGKAITLDQLTPGDLVFYSDNGAASGIHHVAIYSGLDSSGRRVVLEAQGQLIPVHEVVMRTTGLLQTARRISGV
ncbi:MAG: hypothetical protein QOG52_1600 [Frankiaceae bacterium]|nr:hypothetical protein [Frankiaceae bacterium]